MIVCKAFQQQQNKIHEQGLGEDLQGLDRDKTGMNASFPSCVTVVTVTYGQRRKFLEQAIEAALSEGVSRIVIVDNGASWPVAAGLTRRFGDVIEVITVGHNSGSAAGYAAGIERALSLDAEYLWLLDDDNRPDPGCLDKLQAAYRRLRMDYPSDRLAVLAFRPEHQADVAAGVPLHRAIPRRNAFRGFHLLDVPYKFWRRTPWGKPRVDGALPEFVELPTAPYSGLLFHRTVAESIGLPREDFVLYADDLEYTHRLTSTGGCIALVTGAPIEDLETSWSVRESRSTSFGILLNQGSDFRAYYGTRNGAYFETYCQLHDRWMMWLNRSLYLALLGMVARLTGRIERHRLVTQAVKDGLAGRLGLHPRFPL